MKNQNYSKIKTIEELHDARNENSLRLVKVQGLLVMNFLSLRKSMRLGAILVNVFDNSLSLVSHIGFYRRGYMLVRSLLKKTTKKSVMKKQKFTDKK